MPLIVALLLAATFGIMSPPASAQDPTLSVTVTGDGRVQSGRDVRRRTGGIDCDGACSATFPVGTTVPLIAAPSAGQRFAAWGGACAGTPVNSNCQVRMDGDLRLSAHFDPIVERRLSATFDGTGSGLVRVLASDGSVPTSSGERLLRTCTANCERSVVESGTITLEAEAAFGSTFAGWQGMCAGRAGARCALPVNGDLDVGVVFEPSERFEVTVSTTGQGTVSSSPGGIFCGTTCRAEFLQGAVTLRANPAFGHVFAGWSGACASAREARNCVLDLSAPASAAARFVPTPDVALDLDVTGSGRVTGTPDGVACTAACNYEVQQNTTLRLSATPSTSGLRAVFGGACQTRGTVRENRFAGTASCDLVMSEASSVSVRFVALEVNVLRVTVVGDGVVTSRAPPRSRRDPTGVSGGINCGSACEATFDIPTALVLTATPAINASFAGFEGACQGTGECSVTVDGETRVTARFEDEAAPPPTADEGGIVVRVDGGGRVTGASGLLDCPGTCEAVVGSDRATQRRRVVLERSGVTLTATLAVGSRFVAWSGCPQPSATVCTIPAGTDLSVQRAITASFESAPDEIPTRIEAVLPVLELLTE